MFTHVDEQNNPKMVDVSEKISTHRVAVARSIVTAPKVVMDHFNGGEITTKKGPVFQTAIIAGTMAVKKTSELIPFCHPLPIESCTIKIDFDSKNRIIIDCSVSTHHKTGIEMEALCAASITALTIYDMCKALSHDIVIESTQLLQKIGGKNEFKREG